MKKVAISFLTALVVTSVAQAQSLAPAPRAMPRVPVSHETLMEQRDPMPASHQLQGPAAIIDGERLRIGETDLRLFGIVPPQLAASFGPQARSLLDALANGQSVTCHIRDRDRDGRLLATCENAAGSDMALELLKHGLAVTARGSLTGSELASSYLAAEQAAQNQRIGLWSTSIPAPVTPAAVASLQPSAAVKQEVATLAAALPAFAGDSKKDDRPVAPRVDKIVPPVADIAPLPAKMSTADAQAKVATVAAEVMEQHAQAQRAQSQIDQSAWAQPENVGFFERYQILIAGFLMLVTALSIIGALWAQKRRDKRDETKAIGAALRGELMAARGVCIGRIKTINSEAEDAMASWPRIRITLYQAYVGRLGLLGAELARQVASIYGQSSDYGALYNSTATTMDAPKKQALENLVRNIDEILPKLAYIEQAGVLPAPNAYAYAPRPAYQSLPVATAAKAVAFQPAFKTERITERKPAITPEVKNAEHETTDLSHPLPVDVAHPVSHPVTPPVALWEAVRGFIQNHRNAIAQNHAPRAQHDPQMDPHVAEYAAMIEADMARYRYAENVESFDVSPQKKRV